nr:hypothetical protein [Brucella intermedia]
MLEVLKAAYDSDINIYLASFWDGGWEVRIGDEMDGFRAERRLRDIGKVAVWLKEEIILLFPDSEAAKLFSKDASPAQSLALSQLRMDGWPISPWLSPGRSAFTLRTEQTGRALKRPGRKMKALPLDPLPTRLTRPLQAGTPIRTGKGCRNGQGDYSGIVVRALGMRQPERLILSGRESFAAFACRFGGYD